MNINLILLRNLSAVASSGFGAYFMYNQLYRLDNIKAKLELKENDQTINVPPKINNLVAEVMNDMKIKDEDKTRIKPFISKITNTIHLGSLESKTGPYLGIPFYFSVEEGESVAFTVWINQNRIPSNAAETQTLKHSVLLSDSAKKFAIAHELYALIFSKTDIKALLPFVVIVNFNFLSFLLQKYGQSKSRPSIKPHAAMLLIAVFIYILLLNIFGFYTDAEADFLACSLGKSYVQGGIEYYEKMLEKNKGVKKINKNSPFTDDGDIIPSVIKNPQMPIKTRLKYLNDIISEKEKNLTPWEYVFSQFQIFNKN